MINFGQGGIGPPGRILLGAAAIHRLVVAACRHVPFAPAGGTFREWILIPDRDLA